MKPIETTKPKRSVSKKETAARAALVGLGIPGLAMAVLVFAARAGVYVDAVRWAWVPWPDDAVKIMAGLGAFAFPLLYMARLRGQRLLASKV